MPYRKSEPYPKKYGHASQRAWERLNLHLTPHYARQIKRDILGGYADLIEEQAGGKQRWEVFLNGAVVTVIWSKKAKKIITIW